MFIQVKTGRNEYQEHLQEKSQGESVEHGESTTSIQTRGGAVTALAAN